MYALCFKQLKQEEFSAVPSKYLARICAENVKLWNTFLMNVSSKTSIQQHLSKRNHALRIKRFSELFFLIPNSRSSALDCGNNSQNYLAVTELARRY